MNRNELEIFILKNFGAEPDYPWVKYPNYAVFRHSNNRKWFAVVMDIPKNKLGLSGNDMIDVVNLKCNPLLTGSLINESGFFPAYHMNKENWITAALDGSASDDTIKTLLDMSYDATMPSRRKKSKSF